MSLIININKLSQETREKIHKELEVKIENKYGMGQPRYIHPYVLEGDDLKLPFSYAVSLKVPRPKRGDFPETQVDFLSDLRAEQKIVRKEAMQHLSKTGSVMISCCTGYGKTAMSINISASIAFKTLVIINKIVLIKQWKESILKFCPEAKVQCVTAKTKKEEADFYIINAQNVEKMGKKFFEDIGNCVVDECFPYKTPIRTPTGWKYIGDIKPGMEVVTFNEKKKLFETQKVLNVASKATDRNILKLQFYSGSRMVTCTDNHRFLTTKGYTAASELKEGDLLISQRNDSVNSDISIAFNEDQKQIVLGSFLGDGNIEILKSGRYRLRVIHIYSSKHEEYCKWKAFIFQSSIEKIENKKYNRTSPIFKFTSPIFDLHEEIPENRSFGCPQWLIDQIDERALAIWYMDMGSLDAKRETIIFCTHSFPKESVERIIAHLKRFDVHADMVLFHNCYFIKLEKEPTKKFLSCVSPYIHPAMSNKVFHAYTKPYVWSSSFFEHGFLKVKSVLPFTDENIENVYDIEVENNHNFIVCSKSSFTGPVVHNCHLIMAETLFKSLQYVKPRYLIGLTATPYRPDGLDSLLKFYFGNNKIIRKLYREHTIYKVSTGFKPPVEKTMQGRINWGSILDAQASNTDRNDLIVRIIRKFQDRNFLVLVKRVEQGHYLVEKLKNLGESITDLIGSNQEFNTDARVLVGTCQKVGVGFDHQKLDTLLLATDLEEYFIQYLGRIFRCEDNYPIVFDLVDDNSILNKHFNTRKNVYMEHGGKILQFDISKL